MEPPTYLATKNLHARDERISFEEGPHIYTIDGVRGSYTSVTTWNHSHFDHFDADKVIDGILKSPKWENDPSYKYYKKTREEMKEMWADKGASASTKGTGLHYNIELFYNNEPVDDKSIEYQYFLQFQKEHSTLIPYRTEWMIFHEELMLCGSVDMVFKDPEQDGIYIYDWKRVLEFAYENKYGNKTAHTPCISHLPDTNFYHYSLQLNVYRYILEQKYGQKVLGLYLVALHPDNVYKRYEKVQVPFLDKEISDLTAYRLEQVEEIKNASKST